MGHARANRLVLLVALMPGVWACGGADESDDSVGSVGGESGMGGSAGSTPTAGAGGGGQAGQGGSAGGSAGAGGQLAPPDFNLVPRTAPRPKPLSPPIDVTSWVPSMNPGTKPLFPLSPPASKRFGVMDDGNHLMLPECSAPVVLSPTSPGAITVDGDLGDWDQKRPMIIDRAGDAKPTASGTIDIVRVHHRIENSDHHFAFVLADDWPTADPKAWIALVLYRIDIPSSRQQKIDFAFSHTIGIRPTGVFELVGNQSVPLDPSSYSLVRKGKVIELRLAKTELGGSIGGATWEMVIEAYMGSSATPADVTGNLLFGFTSDYACMVSLPKGRAKMFVLHRAAGIQDTEAELAFRAVLSSAAYVEQTTGETYDETDTIAVLAVRTMNQAGVNHAGTIALALDAVSTIGLPHSSPLDLFEAAAHEYAHGINDGDWRLPVNWIREGHSQQSAGLAMGAAFHAGVAQWRQRAIFQFVFVGPEDDMGTSSLEGWDLTKQEEGYYYAKSHAFVEGLTTLLPYSDLNSVWRAFEQTGDEYADGVAVLSAIAMKPGFTGTRSASMWSGWMGGSYDSGTLKRSSLLADTDVDGLFDYQERLLGSDPAKADTDGDGASDLFELATGRDLKKMEPLLGLVVDNNLSDWDRLAPSLLKPAASVTGPNACPGSPRMKRHGVAFDGQWLVIAIELDKPVTDRNFQLIAELTERGGRRLNIGVTGDGLLVSAFEGNVPLRSTSTIGPGIGSKQFEIAYHRSWLGWETLPAGVQARVATAGNGGMNMAKACEVSDNLVVETALP